ALARVFAQIMAEDLVEAYLVPREREFLIKAQGQIARSCIAIGDGVVQTHAAVPAINIALDEMKPVLPAEIADFKIIAFEFIHHVNNARGINVGKGMIEVYACTYAVVL